MQRLVRQPSAVSREQHEHMNGQRSRVVWLTGLSGAGKSTIAYGMEERLYNIGRRSIVLDGDNIRHGLCADLDFSDAGRRENLRRVAEVAKLFVEAGIITIAAFISPLRIDREMVKQIVGAENFLEIYVRCPLSVCEERDVKGLYKEARNGDIKVFTGVSSPYEAPVSADLVLDTNIHTLEVCLEQLGDLLNACSPSSSAS